ncbi:hypothetical protein Cgig2_026545 [Carnegiea gigantea]|uniref:Uncharacterized protein n=1 Tax=Carnegiea gigantea TaxID=171969 RepID=A0A9Q1QHD3_9CARY|nr:hypothetical protein Cgig2_026545 [Carnegiea gigantea]
MSTTLQKMDSSRQLMLVRKRKRMQLQLLVTVLLIIHETHASETSTGKGKERKRVVDLACALNDVFSHLSKFMSDMNSHISIIANALSTTQQHERVIMPRKLKLDEQKKGLFNEVTKIQGLTKGQAMAAVRKLSSNMSDLFVFYQCPDDEWKKDFILSLLYPNLPSSSMG